MFPADIHSVGYSRIFYPDTLIRKLNARKVVSTKRKAVWEKRKWAYDVPQLGRTAQTSLWFDYIFLRIALFGHVVKSGHNLFDFVLREGRVSQRHLLRLQNGAPRLLRAFRTHRTAYYRHSCSSLSICRFVVNRQSNGMRSTDNCTWLRTARVIDKDSQERSRRGSLRN